MFTRKFKKGKLKLMTIMTCLCLIISFSIFALTNFALAADNEKESGETKEIKPPDKQLVVTYFHTTYRCTTCKKIERYSKEIVEKEYEKELKDQKIIYRSLDMTEPANKHYIEEYKLVTKSIVLSITEKGKELKWKNLPDIWKTIKKKEKFENYIIEEMKAYLKEI